MKRLILLSLFLIQSAIADPFQQCDERAFLVQGSNAVLYGVNLVTGYYETLSTDMGTTGKLNAIGFSVHDNFFYAYSSEYQAFVRIHNDYQIETLAVSNQPSTNFYVGDVSTTDNAYYFYRPGSSFGFYRLGLDPQDSDYLNVVRIVDGATVNFAIYDFAFHPQLELFYSVDSSGRLITLDPIDGSSNILGDVGERGTFGAVYFDSDGYLYISRNKDGHIYRVNVNSVDPQAEFFAHGPSSSNNDGARCALAEILGEDSQIDFGSAPESYGTSLDGNGARHESTGELKLGDEGKGPEDGIEFNTGMESGLTSLITVDATGAGYVNAWADWDQSGTFDSDEKLLDD